MTLLPESAARYYLHRGNGGSITAVKDGKSVDTTMGLTPLEGIMMGTLSGDIDAGAVTFLMEKEGLDSTGMSNLLNKKSGLLGISGASSDMREVTASMEAGNERAALAKKMYNLHRIHHPCLVRLQPHNQMVHQARGRE